MILESITVIEKSRDKFRAVFDDGTELKVTAVQIADFSLFSGREISDEEFTELNAALELGSAKVRALRMLGSRNLSARELEKRLAQKGESAETAQQTVEWLENLGLVNDPEYASMIVSHYAKKNYGVARIRDELFRRGIPRELWDETLEGLGEMDGAAYEFLEKKLRGSNDKNDVKRASDALYRRGFKGDEIRAAVSRYLENLGETEDFYS